MCYKKEYVYILGSNEFPGSHDRFWNSICWRFMVFQSLDIPSQLSTKFFHIRINWVILIGTTCKNIQTVKLRKLYVRIVKICKLLKVLNCFLKLVLGPGLWIVKLFLIHQITPYSCNYWLYEIDRFNFVKYVIKITP